MPGKQRECRGCQKVMRSDNLKKHEKICKGFTKKDMTIDSSLRYIQPGQPVLNSEQQSYVDDIISNGVHRSKRDVQPAKVSRSLSKKLVVRPPISERKEPVESSSASEDGYEREGKNMEIDHNVMPDNPKELMEAFRSVYKKLQSNLEVYNNLIQCWVNWSE